MTRQIVMRVFHDHTMVADHPPESHQRTNPDGSADVVQFQYGADGTVTEQILGHYNPGEWHAIGNIVCGYVTDDPKCTRCHPPARVASTSDQRRARSKPADIQHHASVDHLHEQDQQLNNS